MKICRIWGLLCVSWGVAWFTVRGVALKQIFISRGRTTGSRSLPHHVTEPATLRIHLPGSYPRHRRAAAPAETEAAGPPSMSLDVAVSLAVMASAVVLSDTTRRISRRLLPDTSMRAYAAEFASAFQQCCCTHEIRLLGETGTLRGGAALALTYAAAVVHALTFRGATGNPIAALEHAYRGGTSVVRALLGIFCQLLAAASARPAVQVLWGRGLSGMHAQHALNNFRCASAIRAPLLEAACVELACAFAVQSVHAHTRRIQQKYRVHLVAAVITSVVYAGGGVTGAVFNPALALSTQFGCSGNSLSEYCLVYWMGPLMGMMASVLIFDQRSSQSSPQDAIKRK